MNKTEMERELTSGGLYRRVHRRGLLGNFREDAVQYGIIKPVR